MKDRRRVDSPGYAPTETSSMAGDEEQDEEEDKEVEEGEDDDMDSDEDNEERWRSQSWSSLGIECPPPCPVTRQPLRRQPVQLMLLP